MATMQTLLYKKWTPTVPLYAAIHIVWPARILQTRNITLYSWWHL